MNITALLYVHSFTFLVHSCKVVVPRFANLENLSIQIKNLHTDPNMIVAIIHAMLHCRTLVFSTNQQSGLWETESDRENNAVEEQGRFDSWDSSKDIDDRDDLPWSGGDSTEACRRIRTQIVQDLITSSRTLHGNSNTDIGISNQARCNRGCCL